MVHILLAAIVIVAFIGRNKDRSIQRFAFFLLFLFAALRYMYGNDYRSYLTKFEFVKLGRTDVFDSEILFTLLNQISPSFYFLIAVTSLVFVYAAYYLMTRTLPKGYVWIGLLIFLISPYLFLMNLSALRQCLAMVLFIVAAHFAIRRKLIPYVLLILTASLFHKSAIILLPFYFLITPTPVRTGNILLVLVVMLLGLYVVDVQELTILASEWFDDQNYEYYAAGGAQNTLRATLLSSVYLVFVLLNLPKLKGRALMFGKLYLISAMLGVLTFRLSVLTRIQMYFDIFSVVTIPAILLELKKEGPVKVTPQKPVASVWMCVNHYVLPMLVLLIYALRYYSFFTNPTWERFTEYQTIFTLWF